MSGKASNISQLQKRLFRSRADKLNAARFRSKIADLFRHGITPTNADPYSPHELEHKLGKVSTIGEKAEILRDFHDRQVLDIVGQFKSQADPMKAALQLAETRNILITWMFRIAANESDQKGNLALAIGGSTVNGVLTFLTDFDFVVIPHSAEDRQAARNVQLLMSRTLLSIGIEADYVMPVNFDFETFEALGGRYEPIAKTNLADPFDNLARRTSASFLRFLMDIKIVDAVKTEQGKGVARAEYERGLDNLKDRLVYSKPDNMIDLCGHSYWGDLTAPKRVEEGYVMDVKREGLRLFHYALNAGRAAFKIRGSSFWENIDLLEKQGVITSDERVRATAALQLFLGIRHLIGISLTDAKDSTKINDYVMEAFMDKNIFNVLASIVGKPLQRNRLAVTEAIQESRNDLVAIARKILEYTSYQFE